MSLPPVTASRLTIVRAALDYLCIARDLLREAGAPKATAAVRHAISSAKGAERHAELAPYREARQLAQSSVLDPRD